MIFFASYFQRKCEEAIWMQLHPNGISLASTVSGDKEPKARFPYFSSSLQWVLMGLWMACD